MTERHLIATRSYAFEGNCFVVAAAQLLRAEDVPGDLVEAYLRGVGPEATEQESLFDGGSCVVGPDGEYVVKPQFGVEGIITATLDDRARSREQKALDVTGHYSRPDIFTLSVDRRRRSTIDLVDG
jgi:predicted amidohydrolase